MATVDFITTAEYKAQIEKSGTDRDAVIAALITAASVAINDECQRELTPKTASASRTFHVAPCSRIVDLAPYDLRTVVSITLEGTALVADSTYVLHWLDPKAGTYLGVRLGASVTVSSEFVTEFGYGRLVINGAWGAWDTADVPANVKRACVTTVASWLDRAIQAYGVDLGDPQALAPAAAATWGLPPAARMLLASAGLPRLTAV
ncbi:MAG: hypothetical protein IT175_06135 [Acidobacteria bacterium]|nr:hypothetical protein [Acidobacteriota bacterium]